MACHYCKFEKDVGGWATCIKYECRTYLDSVCESFEKLGERQRPLPNADEVLKFDGSWMRYPVRP
jgi:hypothetical protein